MAGDRDELLSVREGEADVRIARDLFVLVMMRIAEEVDRVLVMPNERRHRTRAEFLAIMRGEHADGYLLHQFPNAIAVAAGHLNLQKG